MKPIKRKKRERLSKQMRKLIKKHGGEAITSLVNAAVLAETTKSARTALAHADQQELDKKDRKRKTTLSTIHAHSA